MSALARQSTRSPSDGGGQGGDLSVPVAIFSAIFAAGISYLFRRRPSRSTADNELDRMLNMLKEHGSQQKGVSSFSNNSAQDASPSYQNALRTTAETKTPPELSPTVGGSTLSSNGYVGAEEQESISSSGSEQQRLVELDNLSIAENSRGEKEIYILPSSEASASPRSIGGSVSSLSARRERVREKEEHLRVLLHRAHSKIQLEDMSNGDIGEADVSKSRL